MQRNQESCSSKGCSELKDFVRGHMAHTGAAKTKAAKAGTPMLAGKKASVMCWPGFFCTRRFGRAGCEIFLEWNLLCAGQGLSSKWRFSQCNWPIFEANGMCYVLLQMIWRRICEMLFWNVLEMAVMTYCKKQLEESAFMKRSFSYRLGLLSIMYWWNTCWNVQTSSLMCGLRTCCNSFFDADKFPIGTCWHVWCDVLTWNFLKRRISWTCLDSQHCVWYRDFMLWKTLLDGR